MNAIDQSLSNYGLIGRVGIQAATIQVAETTLTGQATSGLIAPEVAGLGGVTGQVLDLQPQLAMLTAYSTNATLASSRLDITQSALTSLSSMASSMAAKLTQLSTSTGSNLQTAIRAVSQSARTDLDALGSILNTKSGNDYVFAGADAQTAPVIDPTSLATGATATAVGTAVAGLASNGAPATLASIMSVFTANPVFSPGIATATNATVDVGSGVSAIVGLPASSTAGMTGASATSTGSGMSDLVAVLTTLSNFGTLSGSEPQFTTFVSDVQTMLSGAERGIDAITTTLGVSQQQIKTESSTNTATADLLSAQISSLTSVDLPTVATQLSATQNQLMASYQLIADLKGMNLANYL
jgi:flagellar hook-associated protein 3 FlgL